MRTPSSEVCKHSSLQQKMFQSRDNQSLYGINIFQSKSSYRKRTVLSGTINVMKTCLGKTTFVHFLYKKKKKKLLPWCPIPVATPVNTSSARTQLVRSCVLLGKLQVVHFDPRQQTPPEHLGAAQSTG